jgi:hypothetical protein
MPAIPDYFQRNREVMSSDTAPEPVEIETLVSRHDLRWGPGEATIGVWGDGVPLGNGDMGVLLYGLLERRAYPSIYDNEWRPTFIFHARRIARLTGGNRHTHDIHDGD